MADLNTFTGIPAEVRDRILFFAASAGRCEGLLGTSQLLRNESLPHFSLPEDCRELRKLRIWVDSSYANGDWLELEYSWNVGKFYYHATKIIKDMDDPVISRLRRIKKVDEVVITLEAPRRGHFVGALLMMLVKCHDAYNLLDAINERPRFEGSLTICFTTERVRPGQSLKEAKPFWECRSTEVLQNAVRRHFYRGPTPMYYEYFLVNNPLIFITPPIFRFNIWPRPQASSLVDYSGRRVVRRSAFEIVDRQNCGNQQHRFGGSSPRDIIAEESTKYFTEVEPWSFDFSNVSRSRHVWEMISADFTILYSTLQFLVDTVDGPRGGPLDMLRLHRFKTMFGSRLNFFAVNQARSKVLRNEQGLLGAAAEINERMRTLFNPLAPDEIRRLRSKCPHLARVEWSQNLVRPSELTSKSPATTWLEFYPQGISYRFAGGSRSYQRGSIGGWRHRWTITSKHVEGAPWARIWTRLYQWWDCRCCCHDAQHHVWETLTSYAEMNRMCDWKEHLDDCRHDPDQHSGCPCPKCNRKDEGTVQLRREAYMAYGYPTGNQSHTSNILSCLKGQHTSWGLARSYRVMNYPARCGRDCSICRGRNFLNGL